MAYGLDLASTWSSCYQFWSYHVVWSHFSEDTTRLQRYQEIGISKCQVFTHFKIRSPYIQTKSVSKNSILLEFDPRYHTPPRHSVVQVQPYPPSSQSGQYRNDIPPNYYQPPQNPHYRKWKCTSSMWYGWNTVIIHQTIAEISVFHFLLDHHRKDILY